MSTAVRPPTPPLVPHTAARWSVRMPASGQVCGPSRPPAPCHRGDFWPVPPGHSREPSGARPQVTPPSGSGHGGCRGLRAAPRAPGWAHAQPQGCRPCPCRCCLAVTRCPRAWRWTWARLPGPGCTWVEVPCHHRGPRGRAVIPSLACCKPHAVPSCLGGLHGWAAAPGPASPSRLAREAPGVGHTVCRPRGHPCRASFSVASAGTMA